MVKVQPIHEKLWGALGLVSNYFDYAQALTGNAPSRLRDAVELLSEYHACFGSDGRVSQRGEIPQCWNHFTIFTPHRKVGEKEVCREQLLLPFEKEVSDG